MKVAKVIWTVWIGLVLVATSGEAPFSLSLGTGPAARPLGPVHLVGGETHRIPLRVRGTPESRVTLRGRMFHLLTSTVAPVCEIAWAEEAVIPPSGVLSVEPEVALPEIKATVRYLIRFQASELPGILILSHPRDFLKPLVRASASRPLILVNPPAKLSALLSRKRIANEVHSDLPGQLSKGAVILAWGPIRSSRSLPPGCRLILCDQDDPDREIWKESPDGTWRIHVHPDTCSPARLTTTAGLVRLVDLAQSKPDH